MIYTAGDAKKELSLKIKTLVIDESEDILSASELGKLLQRLESDEDLSAEELSDNAADSDVPDEIELSTEATIETSQSGLIEISYFENEDNSNLSTISKIIFHPENPSLVIMSKKGPINSALSFEEGKLHVCAYDTPYMPFKMYIDSKKVENRLLDEGKLHLDYILNINNTPPQHFIVNIKIKEAPADTLKGFFEK